MVNDQGWWISFEGSFWLDTEPKQHTVPCGRGNKVCSARPISSQPVGRPSVQWGLPDEQQWTTAHSVTPFPSSDPRPQPCRHFSGAAQQRFSGLYKSARRKIHGRRSWTQTQRRCFIRPSCGQKAADLKL